MKQEVSEKWQGTSQVLNVPTHDEPPVNRDVLAQLSQQYPTTIQGMAQQFLRDAQIHIAAICYAVGHDDDHGLIRATQAFAASCQFMGAKPLEHLCVWLEEEGRLGDVKRLADVLPILEMEYFRTQIALEMEIVILRDF